MLLNDKDEETVCANCGEQAAQTVSHPEDDESIPVCSVQCAYELGMSDADADSSDDEETKPGEEE